MTTQARRPEIDGLRAVAVIPVLLFHAGLMKGGYLGVDIFFIISGYLITEIILKDLNAKQFSFANFYERRVRRILPMLLFMTLCCVPFAWFLMNALQLMEFAQSMIAVEFFVSNFWFAYKVDYFAQATELVPLLHTWSLGVEEQYYLLWPLFLTLLWKFSKRYLLQILIGLTLGSIVIAQILSIKNPTLNFYLLPSRIWELMAGAILAYLEVQRDRNNKKVLQTFAPFCGLVLIIASLLFFGHGDLNPDLWTLIPAAGTLLVIWYGGGQDIATSILKNKVLVGIGLISYSIYLWHQPILAFTRLLNLGYVPKGMLYAYIPLTIFISYFSWRFIERPFQNKKILTRRQVLCIISSMAIFILAIAIFILRQHGLQIRSNVPQKTRDTMRMSKNFEEYEKVGDLQRKKIDFFVLGDSHVRALLPAINAAALKNDKLGIVSQKVGCFPIFFPENHRKSNSECMNRNQQAFEFILKHNIKHVIWIARWQRILGYPDPELVARQFQLSFESTVKLYAKHGIQLQIMLQTPQQHYNAQFVYPRIYRLPEALRANSLQSYAVSVQKYLQQQRKIINLMQPYLVESIRLYAPTDFVCMQSICPIGTVEEAYYYDNDHLTITGSKRLIPLFNEMIKDFKD